ncbi:SHOCT domain-containing protein [Salinirubrum litoreum]|uniref:SHOCT domain-containing protein n=1 Tax=Salinirubrum litoreum TaxID=1126234 RepID=A0ABD5RDV3_9EURY|nr:SHOCT domain-containing protein [Salinirubrum litoreum]
MSRRNPRNRGQADSKWTDSTANVVSGVVAGVVSAGVLVVAFGALALGVEAWWLAFPVGYGGVLPLSVGLARWRTGDGRQSNRPVTTDEDSSRSTAAQSTGTDEAALATLRRRYAEGAIDEVEFEHRVETLLGGGESRSGDR